MCGTNADEAQHRAFRCWLAVVQLLHAPQFHHRRETDARALHRRVAGDECADRRPGRLFLRSHLERHCAGSERDRKGLCDRIDEPEPGAADGADSQEAGLPQFQASAWYALFAPKGTPKPVVDGLALRWMPRSNDGKVRGAAGRARLRHSSDKSARGPQPLADLVHRDIALWAPIIKAATTAR